MPLARDPSRPDAAPDASGTSESIGWEAILRDHPELGEPAPEATDRRSAAAGEGEGARDGEQPSGNGALLDFWQRFRDKRLGAYLAVMTVLAAPGLRFLGDWRPDLDLDIDWDPGIADTVRGVREKIEETVEETKLPDELLYVEGWRDVEQLYELPSGISDAGVILFASRPLADTDIVREGRKADRDRYYDNLLEYNALSELLWKGRILYIDYTPTLKDHHGKTTRGYHFTLPSEEQGELIPGRETDDMLNVVWWPELLNKLTRAPKATDDEVKDFLVWWYARTFVNQEGRPVQLSRKALRIERDEHGHIEGVDYKGSNNDDLLQFHRVRYADHLYAQGRNANRTYESVPKPLTKDGELIPWTGAYQDLVVPETFLRTGGTIKKDLKGYGIDEEFEFTWAELADSLRLHYKNRHAGKLLFYRKPGTGKIVFRKGWDSHIATDDPIIKRLVKIVTKGAGSRREALDRLRVFTQDVEYKSESSGVEVNRPPAATFILEWGDCNNRTVWAVSVYGTGGYDVAIAYVENDPGASESIASKFPQYAFSSHVLPAVERRHLGDSYAGGISKYDGAKEEWVLVETEKGWPFGSSLPPGMALVALEEVGD